MEEKNMRELSLEEMDKISGGANPGTECPHNWIFYAPASVGELRQCTLCGVIKCFVTDPFFNTDPEPIPNPNPPPLPMD